MHGTKRRASARESPDLVLDDEALVRVFKALAHPKRFAMLQEIASKGESSCGGIGGCLDIPQPTVSHHLKLLIDAGVVLMRPEAQRHVLSVNQPLLDSISSCLPRTASRRRT